MSYNEIRKSCMLVDFDQNSNGFWVETYMNEHTTYEAIFTDNYFDLPMTIYTKYDNFR